MKVFIDMDGVLVRFNKAALAVHGIYYTLYPVKCGWDIVAACNKLRPDLCMTPSKFWNRLRDINFWATLPKSSMCDDLIRTVRDAVGYENMCILSSCAVEGSADGKLRWINDNLPSEMRHHYLFGRSKDFCAHPGALLIDDCDANVAAFRASGGKAILVPRPWNEDWIYRMCGTVVTLERFRYEAASFA